MDPETQAYLKELNENGVEVPEIPKVEEKKEEAAVLEKPAAAEEAPKTDEPKDDDQKKSEDKSDEPLKDEPKEPRKPRSIYDDLKEKKKDLKTERELREQTEKELAEAKQKIADYENAGNKQEKQDAKDALVEFAKKADADPEILREMRELFLKDLPKNELSEEDRQILEEAKAARGENQIKIIQQEFENEFQAVLPEIKKIFPTASAEEMDAVKKELDRLSHHKDWHDKDLDYIAYKHQDSLGKLVSPKKRGMEGKGAKDIEIVQDQSFNLSPDFSKMTAKEIESWEKQYHSMGNSDGLITAANGKKMII